jgi:predicted esterase
MTEEAGRARDDAAYGRLSVRRKPVLSPDGRTGTVTVEGVGAERPALAFVPEPVDELGYRLVVSLHGAGGSARQGLELLRPLAAELGVLVVAPQSAAASWDLIHGGLGPDVRRLDRVLTEIIDRYPVRRMAIGGFSDGASYALSLGLANGDVIPNVIAFSPGFVVRGVRRGTPAFFVSHGTADQILNIDRASRPIVASLRGAGYVVEYREFDGRHQMPPDIADAAMEWLVKRQM